MTKEPAILIGAVAEAFRQFISLLIGFEVIHWTQAQQTLVFAFTSALLTVLTVAFIRYNTVSFETAREQIKTALNLPADTPVKEVIDKTADKETN